MVRSVGVHQSKSLSTSLLTSPTDSSHSSKKIWRLTVCGLLPTNSGAEPASVCMLRCGCCHCALFFTEYSLGLNLNSSFADPSISSSRALTIFIASCSPSP